MVVFIARLTVKAGKEQEFETKMRAAVPEVRKEPGNLVYAMCRVKDNPRVFVFYEEYRDDAALSAHRRHLKELGIDFGSMLEGPPALEFLDKIAS
jgi:quinol monooxygenase YgiN